MVIYVTSIRIKIRVRTNSSFCKQINQNDQQNKLSFLGIIIISLLFVLYNYCLTKMNPDMTHDRRVYSLFFHGYRSSPSLGLSFISDLIHKFSSNVETLFYVTTVIVMIITLLAYRTYKEASSSALLFLLATQYVFFSYEALKQAYSNAFAFLCIALIFRDEGKKDKVLSILAMVLAILFHHTGYFIIPLYLMLRIKKNKKTIIAIFTFIILLLIFFKPILLLVANAINPIDSSLTAKILQYFGDTATESLQTEGSLTVIKGIPFYILTLVGLIKRNKLINKIENYDNHLFLSGMLSFTYIATLYNGWVYRLSYYLLLSEGVFFTLLMKNTENSKNKVLLLLSTVGITAIITIRFVILMYVNYGGF